MKKIVIRPCTLNILGDANKLSGREDQEYTSNQYADNKYTNNRYANNQYTTHNTESPKKESWKQKFKRFCTGVCRNAKEIVSPIISILGAVSTFITACANFRRSGNRGIPVFGS